jgi:hypothetical protein
MSVDARGGLWLDNPLLVLGLLSLLWVVVATLHAEPWLRRRTVDEAPSAERRDIAAFLFDWRTTVKRTRLSWQAERRVRSGRGLIGSGCGVEDGLRDAGRGHVVQVQNARLRARRMRV